MNINEKPVEENIINEGKFKYVEFGDGNPIVILHGLMGGLSNFNGVIDFFPKKKIQNYNSKSSPL